MSENEVNCSNGVCLKHELNENKIERLEEGFIKLNEKLEKVTDHVNNKIDKMEGEINLVDKTLGDRMLILETTYKINTESINSNISKIDKKMDRIIDNSQKQELEAIEKQETAYAKKDDRRFEWVKIVGAVVVGIVITYIAKKLGIA